MLAFRSVCVMLMSTTRHDNAELLDKYVVRLPTMNPKTGQAQLFLSKDVFMLPSIMSIDDEC